MRFKLVLFTVLLAFFSQAFFGQNQKVDSLKSLIKTNKKDSTAVNRLLQISVLLNKSEPNVAQQYANDAIVLAKEINYKKGLAYGYKNLGLPLYFKGELTNELVGFWKKSLEIFEEIEDKQGISNLLNNLGGIYQTKGDDPTALNYFLNSVRLAEEIGDSLRIATAYLNIGSVYSNEELTLEQALAAYTKSKQIFEVIDYQEGVGYIAINMAELYLKDKDAKAALYVLDESLIALKKSGGNIATSLIMMGQAHSALGDFTKAGSYLKRGLAMSMDTDAKIEESKAYLELGHLYNRQNKLTEATNSYLKALEISQVTQVYRDKRDVYDGLARTYSKLGDFQNAYTYQKLFSAMRDTIRSSDYEKTVGGLRFQFDIENKEKEIALLNTENELKQVELERAKVSKRYFLVIATLLLLIVIGYVSRYRFMQKSNKKLAEERNKAETILLNILPKETAEELKLSGKIKAKEFKEITILFTDFKEFSVAAEKITADKLVKTVDYYFSKFDEIIEKNNLEKIKTIGDAYMCAGGLPTKNKTNAEDAFNAALEIMSFVNLTEKNPPKGIHPFKIRIGINTGPVVAGVVGTKKFQYDIWGSSVNIAARMESNSIAGKINVSENTYQLLKDKISFTYRGVIKVKNSQSLKMYFAEEKVS